MRKHAGARSGERDGGTEQGAKRPNRGDRRRCWPAWLAGSGARPRTCRCRPRARRPAACHAPVTGSIAGRFAAGAALRARAQATQPQAARSRPIRSPIRSPPCWARPAPTAALNPEQRAHHRARQQLSVRHADAVRQIRPGRPRRQPHPGRILHFQKPGKVRFEYDAPSPIDIDRRRPVGGGARPPVWRRRTSIRCRRRRCASCSPTTST